MNADDIEARLIEAVRVFDRLERTGPGFATDGPWRMMVRSVADARDAAVGALELNEGDRLASAVASAVFNPRPDRDMITRAEEAAGWLGMVAEGDRALVIVAVRALASGHARVPWTRLLVHPSIWQRGDVPGRDVRTWRALSMRYSRALDRLAGAVGRASARGIVGAVAA